MSKKFVVDTSVLEYDIDCLYKFGDNEVIIPSIVLEELNHHKKETSERGYASRRILDILEDLSVTKPLSEGVMIGQTLVKSSYDVFHPDINSKFSRDENDYKIIACAKKNDAILISRDKGMKIFARDNKISAEPYKADIVKTKELYKGYRKLLVPDETVTKLWSRNLENEFGLYPNEFVILEDETNSQHVGIGINKDGKIIPVDFDKMMQSLGTLRLKLKPINLEQKMFLYLLLDDDIKCVTCCGVSGKGKSLVAIDYALGAVNANKYNKLLFTKSVISVDKNEELGFYKGDVNEKLKPHLMPLYSSVEFMFKEELYNSKERKTVDQKVEELIAQDMLMFYPLANIRGMSIFDKVVMLDEAQNTTTHMIKSLVTRLNDNSKLIITGDVEQIDDKNLSKFNNGLTHLIEAGKDEPFIGHITMDLDEKSKRGKLAGFGAKKL